MSESNQSTYLVSAYSEPVIVKIHGKANYLNCNSFREFIEKMVANKKHNLLLDFANCTGMDSTFLGILAGTALELRQKTPPGELTLCRLSERNNELICNLGLQNLLNISQEASPEDEVNYDSLEDSGVTEAENVLKAHENLTEANSENMTKFQDVIAFLRNQVEASEDE